MSIDLETAFRQRLRLIMQQFGSVADLAKAVGVSDNAIYKWVSGRGQPGMASLVSLARAAGVSVEWLATGEGASKARSESTDESAFFTPRRDLLQLSEGMASLDSSQIVDVLRFQADWFQRQFGSNVNNIALFEVRGDSMAPTIDAGDLCLADVADQRFTQDGVYALCRESELIVKRLQRDTDGTLMMLSDNPAYSPLRVGREEITIVGRVIWICGKP